MCFSASPRPLLSSPPFAAVCALVLLALAFTSRTQAQIAPQADRIASQPDLARTTQLSGHLPAWVTPSADTGPAPGESPLRLTVVLARAPALQSAFEQLLADQQNPASPRFHQWLTPTQIGEQFGPTPADLAAITQWLTASGFQLAGISPARTFITVTGSANTAAAAFSTTFHLFTYNGIPRLSATSEPTIPAAFAQVVTAIEGLTDLPIRPLHRAEPAPPRTSPDSLHPLYSNSSNTLHYIFPGDFATIYDIAALTSAGYNGAGVKVAIIARSEIANSDITQLQALAGLPSKVPNVVLVPGSADPGVVAADTGESTLDVGRVLTTAPGAQADLVLAANASGGLSAALQYNVNTLLDPIMTLSYGLCESSAGASNVTFFNTLFSQAAAEGISTFISSGDAAAAGCSSAFTTPTGKEVLGMGNYLCASSYVTCVGGSEFNDANPGPYWSTTNTTTFASALGYIPEGAWNEPTTINANGATVFQIAGTGSGPSAFIPKPSWQTGTGIPNDGARDTPDVSFTSSGHDGFFACLASSGSGYDCSKGGGVIYSGTSVAAPSMAAIAAILEQRLQLRQGNLNPLLYQIAASTPAAFHDATPASSGVSSCTTATASLCNNSVAGPTSITGGLAGYPLQIGYDLVTGLGSLDVTNFINAVSSPSSLTLTASPSSVTLSAAAANVATSTITASITGSFTGSASLACAITPATAIPPGCSLSPSTLTFTSAGSATSTLTLSTITPRARTIATTLKRGSPLQNHPLQKSAFAALMLALIPAARRRRFHPCLPRLLGIVPLTLMAGTLLTLTGCGGTTGVAIGSGGSTPTPTPSGTTPGAYQVTITATSGATVAHTSITLTVQ